MKMLQMDLIGSAPLLIQPNEDVELVKVEIIKNFEKSFHAAIKIKKISNLVKVETTMEIKMVNAAERLDRRMGVKKFQDWKLTILISYDDKKVSQEQIVEVIELAAGKPPED